jgi:chromosome segregation ATPase
MGVYRQVINDVVPLGIGLTENPAADVVGVLTQKKQEKTLKLENNSSQKQSPNVNNNKDLVMKLNSIQDITDENLKEMAASSVSDFIEEQLKQASEKFSAEKSQFETELAEAKEKHQALLEKSEASEQELESVKAELDALKSELVAKKAEEDFNIRMAKFDEEFELSNEDREVIASDIAGLDQEAFDAYAQKISVLLSSKVKKEQEVVATEEVVASVEPEAKEVVEEVVEAAVPEADVIANSATVETPSFQEKYAKAFSMEGFKFTK